MATAFSIENRPNSRSCYPISSFEHYGLISAADDPGIHRSNRFKGFFRLSDQDLDDLDRDAKDDKEGFRKNFHLPKGLFSPNKVFDAKKKSLVINFIEDDKKDLLKTLKALDQYFKLDIGKAKEIKSKYNILIAWSTSLFDSIKVLSLVKKKIKDLNKAMLLFLNDKNINRGTGPNWNYDLENKEGQLTSAIALHELGFNKDRSKTLIQTLDPESGYAPQNLTVNTKDWLDQSEEEVRSLLYDEFKSNKPRVEIKKLCDAVDFERAKFHGVQAPIEAFVDLLAKS